MSPTKARDKRRLCIPCILGGVLVLFLVAGFLLSIILVWTQRDVIDRALVSADSLAKGAPTAPAVPPPGSAGACCGGCAGCAPSLTGALSLFGEIPMWPMLPILALLVFLAFVIFTGVGALILLLSGANPATLTQLGTFLATAIQLLPQIRGLAAALRTTADGLDLGETAATSISTGLGNAATFLNTTASSIDSVGIPGRDWSLHRIGETPFYNIVLGEAPSTTPFHYVAEDLRDVKAEIETAGTKTSDLAAAFKEAAKRLREAAGILDGMGAP